MAPLAPMALYMFFIYQTNNKQAFSNKGQFPVYFIYLFYVLVIFKFCKMKCVKYIKEGEKGHKMVQNFNFASTICFSGKKMSKF